MEFSTILSPIAGLFLMMALGYLCGKRHLFSEAFIHDLTTLLMEIGLPCMVFSSMLQEVRPELIQESLWIFVATLAFTTLANLLSIALAALGPRLGRKRNFWAFAATYSNNGFMGFPVVYALFGAEGLFLAAIYNAAINIHMYTAGVLTLNRKQEGAPRLRLARLLLSNVNIALLLGLACFFFQPPLPVNVANGIKFFGDLTTPLSMLIVGLHMARHSLRQAAADKAVWAVTAVRLVALPLLALWLAGLFTPAGYELPYRVFVVLMAMPVPVITVIFAEQFNGPADFATDTVVVSTLLCMVTVPLLMLIV